MNPEKAALLGPDEHTSAQPPPYTGPQEPTTAYPGTTVPPPPQYQYGGDQQQPYGGSQGQYGYQQFQLPPPDLGMPQAAVVQPPPRMKEHYYMMSVALSIIWCLLCAPYLLCCSVPAICFAQQSKDAAREGDMTAAKKNAQNALYCNIASIVCAVIAYISLIVIVPIFSFVVVFAVSSNTSTN